MKRKIPGIIPENVLSAKTIIEEIIVIIEKRKAGIILPESHKRLTKPSGIETLNKEKIVEFKKDVIDESNE